MTMKIRAYMRAWYADGIKPEKVLNPETGRMHLPFKFKLHETTANKCLNDDVPLVDGRAVAKLIEASKVALESDGGTAHEHPDDDVGFRVCCGMAEFKEHKADCWVPQLRAALADLT